MKAAKSNKRKLWVILLSVAAVAVLCAGLFLFASRDTEASEGKEEKKTITVSSAEEAAAQLAELSEELGYENALSELTEKSTNTVDGDCYYRLQQTYQGIPVYGRTVVYVTDENGNTLSVTGNAFDVDETTDDIPTVTAEEIYIGIEHYALDTLGFASGDCTDTVFDQELVWYVDSTGDTKLAYSLVTYIAGMPYEVVVDAADGTVYTASCQVMTESVPLGVTVDGYTHQVNLWRQEDGNYTTYDSESNIRVRSANGETLAPAAVVEDSTGKTFFYDVHTKAWIDETGAVCKKPESYTYKWYRVSTIENRLGITLPTSEKLTEMDEDACRILFYVTVANDYFTDTLSRVGWANSYDETLQLFFDCANASSYYWYPAPGDCIICIKSGRGLNTVTHELTHAMERTESGMTYSGESGAIMEALSDIFAAIVELDITGECDWVQDGTARNLKDPYSAGYPVKITDQNKSRENYVHAYSTVISHAAYLMWNGIDGTESKKISTDDLAKLWYRAMLMMPSDCDFARCRTLVELAGKNMELTDEQMQCIGEAFDNAGILSESTVDFIIAEETELSVYGADAKLYGNYTITIVGQKLCLENIDDLDKEAFKIPLDIAYLSAMLTQDYSDVIEVPSAQSTRLQLPIGRYTITLCDHADSSKSFSFSVFVGGNVDQKTLDIYTYFSADAAPSDPSSEAEKPAVSEPIKRLAQINRYDEAGDLDMSYEFCYDETGLLTGIAGGTTYRYDAEGRLISAIHGEPCDEYKPGFNSGSMYTYNDLGQLIEEKHWEGGGTFYYHEYDDSGKRIKTESDMDYAKSVKEYSYDASGVLVSAVVKTVYTYRDETQTETVFYSWDEKGRLASNIYDYYPLVISENAYGGYDARLESLCGYTQDDLYYSDPLLSFSDPVYSLDEDGFLAKVVDPSSLGGNYTYEFIYQSAEDQNSSMSFPDCYIAVLENHPETVEKSYGTNVVSIDTEWALYDIDKNGVPELIVREEENNYYIYTCEAGTAKLCGNCYWPHADCLREYNGNGIVVQDGGSDSRREYSLFVLNDGVLRMAYTIAGLEECTYNEIHDILDACTVIDSFRTIKEFKFGYQTGSETGDSVNDVISGVGPYDIEWTLDAQGTLTIGGNGEMKDCDPVVTGAGWLYENILSKTEEIKYDQIKKIVVHGSILRLGESAFSMCTSVETVVIEEGITEIGAWAFLENSSLKTIYLPESLEEIQNLAIYNCPQLTDVYYAGDESSWNNVKVLGDNSSLMDATIHYEK